jgi:hypothetical protein
LAVAIAIGAGGGADEALVVLPSDTTVELGENTEEQPAIPPVSSAVNARQGHLMDRVRILSGLSGFPEEDTSGEVA